MEDRISQIERKIRLDENACQKILGRFLIVVATTNTVEALIKIASRLVLKTQPDVVGYIQGAVAILKLLFVIIAFFYCINDVKKLHFHSTYIRKLLVTWGIILIPVQLIYDICTIMYSKMLVMASILLNSDISDAEHAIYSMFYDSTHGFKYIGMFIAILLGIVMTGELLGYYRLIAICGILAVVFMVAFCALRMQTLSITTLSISIGINWTSVLFHSLTTLGLFLLGMFILAHYKKEETEF